MMHQSVQGSEIQRFRVIKNFNIIITERRTLNLRALANWPIIMESNQLESIKYA
jgi:hypothetical protein